MASSQGNSRVLRGTLNMLIMRVLQKAATHGYGIMKQIEAGSGDVLKLEEGSLYPALHRLEKDGFLASEWRQSESNRRAKFYSLTDAGRQFLEMEVANWALVSAAVQRVVEGEGSSNSAESNTSSQPTNDEREASDERAIQKRSGSPTQNAGPESTGDRLVGDATR